MRGDETVEIAEAEGRVMMRRPNGDERQAIGRRFVGPENIGSIDLASAVEPRDAIPHFAVRRHCRRLGARRRHHGGDDLRIAGAAAEHAAEHVLDLRFARRRIVPQQRDRRNDHARRADSALRRAMVEKSLFQPLGKRVVEPFDGRDRASLDLTDGGQAGADGRAVDKHRAGAAIAGVAARLDAGDAEIVAQGARQPPRRIAAQFGRRVVEDEADAAHAATSPDA